MPLTLRLSHCELQKLPLPQRNGGMGVQVPVMPRDVHIGPLDLHMGSVQGLPDILPCLLGPGSQDGTQSAGESQMWGRVRDLACPSFSTLLPQHHSFGVGPTEWRQPTCNPSGAVLADC